MTFTEIAIPIILGAIIGYFTNYIAIKMLFRPKKPWMIGKFQIPFTPGIVPKNKDRIARAVGRAVGDTLITKDDIKHTLQSDDICHAVSMELSKDLLCSENTPNILIGNAAGEERLAAAKDKVCDYVFRRIMDGISQLDLQDIIIKQGSELVQKKALGGILSLIVNDKMIESMAEPIANGIHAYVDEHAEELAKPVIIGEIEKLGEKKTGVVLREFGISEELLVGIVENVYQKAVERKADELIGHFNIPGIVEKRINEMDTDELEELVMSVMKKELNAIINLGALIGGVIGALNLLFQ